MRKLVKFLLPLIPAALAFSFIFFEPFYGLDAMLCDLVYTQMNGTGEEIKIIAVDEETLDQYGTFSNWSREKSAELISYLNEDKTNAPAVLAFDFMYIGTDQEETDQKLVDAAKEAGNVVVGSNLVYRGKNKYGTDGMPYYDAWNIEMEERPFENLNAVAFSGFTNVPISKDGFVRTTQLSAMVEGEERLSFATQIHKLYSEAKNVDVSLPKCGANQQVQFFYSGKPYEFTHYSMTDVLDGKIPASEFADKIVLVGAYAPGFQDAYHSAAKRGQDMYGVEINANIVRALMVGKTGTKLPRLWMALLAAVVFGLYTYMAREMKMYPALLIGVWILLVEGIGGRILATKGYLISLVYGLIICLLIMAWIVIEKYVLETVKRKRVLNSFRKYMAPQVIDNLSKNGEFHIELGGEKRHVAVLFVDIRGFTTMSESLSPEEVVQILNQYLSLMTTCIFDHGGMLDKFIGDAAMAIYNAPNDQEDYVYQAILSGLQMQTEGVKLGEKLLEQYGKTVSFGVGVHVGEAVVGNIGSDTRMDYTAIGDTVNTTSRIEGKAERGELLISEDAYELVKDRIEAEYKDAMALKGKAEPVKVYRVVGIKETNEEE